MNLDDIIYSISLLINNRTDYIAWFRVSRQVYSVNLKNKIIEQKRKTLPIYFQNTNKLGNGVYFETYYALEDGTLEGLYEGYEIVGGIRILIDKGYYKNNQKKGRWYFYNEGKIARSTEYKNGKHVGIEYMYGHTGNLHWITIYGEKENRVFQYKLDGTLLCTFAY